MIVSDRISGPEAAFRTLWRILAVGLPQPVREFRFAAPRRWRFDFAWPDSRIAVEIEGGIWSRGRHVRPAGYARDAEKYNAAAAAGWVVLRYTSQQLDTDPRSVVEQVESALRARMVGAGQQ